MLSRERVLATIEHKKADRMPVYSWLSMNLTPQISAIYGSVEAFEDKYEFDLAHLFGGPTPYPPDQLDAIRQANGGEITPAALMDVEMGDPDDMAAYETLKQQIAHHKEQRGRWVYVQTPGIFEMLNDPFGIQQHLMYLMMYEDDLHRVYDRQAEWNRKFAMNCLDIGIDMIHVSDDWGSQNALMFHPDTWRRLIAPRHKSLCDAVKQRGAKLSLHSDGDISSILDETIALGYDVLHPYQESAGMDLTLFKNDYLDKFTVMGGLDVQTTIGFGKIDFLKAEIERVIGMFRDGGMLYCTSHFVQDHCTMDELTTAYDLIYDLVRR